MAAAQATLRDFEPQPLDDLTPAERAIYEAVERGDMGVREYVSRQGWNSPGTASNLLQRARRKLDSGPEGSGP